MYFTIENIIEMIKAKEVNVDGFFLAVELKIKSRIKKVEGILIKKDDGSIYLIVENGIGRYNTPRHTSYDSKTRVVAIL